MLPEQLYSIFLSHPQVFTDTRKVIPGGLFFALKGPNFNGNAFAEAALQQGAAYAVVDEVRSGTDPRLIQVPDVLQTLQELAHHHRMQFAIPVIGITGSNGKTTTKELMAAVCSQQYETLATEGNLNNHIGVPLTLLRLRPQHQLAVIEMGANHQGEIASYCVIAAPTHGLITNVGKAHIEGFGGEEGVRKGKGELYAYLRQHNGTVFLHSDSEHLPQMAAGITHQITYGSGEADTISGRIHPSEEGLLRFEATVANQTANIQTQLVGDYNFPNALAAIAVGTVVDIPLAVAASAIRQYQPDNSRSQQMAWGSNTLILDAYNANPTSMRSAISAFAKRTSGTGIVWLGAMKEMGTESQSEHQSLLQFLRQWPWESVVVVGAEYEDLADATERWFPDVSTALETFRNEPLPAEKTILLKGSRGSRMETLLSLLPESGES
ncbi:MAG: UDP-N-acetylmuramoyl-tripeptide--D-alanyl-D-alanine ligase [Sphingobacteriales bacterium]|nr:MAG: UDP-N-acetylmuramoyl-tripeptide--D-alanyl-D-alanine ligase [Sphingobacteriales bacterium]